MKKVLAISALFLLAFMFSPKTTFAQGTFSCDWVSGGGCFPTNVSCDADHEVDPNYCSGLFGTECNDALATDCIPKSTPSNPCPSDPYYFCTLSSHQPNVTCTNEGKHAHCGGTASYLVLWCCSDDTFNPPPGLGGADPTCDVPGGGKGIDTAIGCIPVENTNAFIGFILGWGIGIGGGIAFLLVIYAGFQITTSSGDPKRLQAGKELLTSALAGLLLLIFSVFILRLVGVEVLGIFQ